METKTNKQKTQRKKDTIPAPVKFSLAKIWGKFGDVSNC